MKFTFAFASLLALAAAEPWATSSWGSSIATSGPAATKSATVTGSFTSVYSIPPSSPASFASSAASSKSSAAATTTAAPTTTEAGSSSSAAASSTFSGAAYHNKEFGGAALAVGALALLL